MAEESRTLTSLPPDEVLARLRPRTKPIFSQQSQESHKPFSNQDEVLKYYRKKYPLKIENTEKLKAKYKAIKDDAKNITQYIFEKEMGGENIRVEYSSTNMNWNQNPETNSDLIKKEWIQWMHRFYWAKTLLTAFQATEKEEREVYGKAFVDLVKSWISKHSIAETIQGLAWQNIQTGIRLKNISRAFQVFIHANAFTSDFLLQILAIIYDHQRKTFLYPNPRISHNKALFEMRGFIDIILIIEEFEEAEEWLIWAFKRVPEILFSQTTPDGVQKEWSGRYHRVVSRDALRILEQMKANSFQPPEEYEDRVHKMWEYSFAMLSPELDLPEFGAGAEQTPLPLPEKRSDWSYYSLLYQASEQLKSEKYRNLADDNQAKLPKQTSYSFDQAGMYVMRNKWGMDQTYFALHCAPSIISLHDQPDNGTFELHAYGQCLMNDLQSKYTYDTHLHQTLTFNNIPTRIEGRHLLWHTQDNMQTLVVENRSYEKLIHRRTVWFINKTFFVLLDEAIGEGEGTFDLNFQSAPIGPMTFDFDEKSVQTNSNGVGLKVCTYSDAQVILQKKNVLNHRTWFRFRHQQEIAPVYFLTMLIPYHTEEPHLTVLPPVDFQPGDEQVQLDIRISDKNAKLCRDLKNGTAGYIEDVRI